MYQRWYGAHLFCLRCVLAVGKMYVLKFCVHTKFLRGVEVGGNVLTIMGFQSIMMAGELGGNIG